MDAVIRERSVAEWSAFSNASCLLGVSIVGSQGNVRWEMTIQGRMPSSAPTLEDTAGQHEPAVIGPLFRRCCRRDLVNTAHIEAHTLL
jgi:hypothetical protein